ncbi:MAG TPA: ABC transporter permease [Methylomirabilota bacterium]|jgi:peptide/nickel transport system permease protein|nr:ABC transporter permease [Methylomirabilota bacterium]
MRRLILRRAVAFLATLFVVSLLVFTVVRVLPGDPALLIMGTEGSPEAAAALRRAMGLDRPIPVQYVEWLGGVLRGDLGRSIQYDVGVGRLILSRLAVTLPLTVLAAVFMTLAAVPLGVYAATRNGRAGDYVTMLLSQLGIAVPSFWAGLLLILLFAVRLGWVQAGGFDGWAAGLWSGLRALLLPAFALGVVQAAILTRTTRAAVLEVLRADYVRTGRAKGLSERTLTWKHVVRNALLTIVTILGLQLGQLLTGSIVLENVFYLPGLGRLALGAISARDLPVVQGVVLFVAATVVTLNFVVDILYAVLDPRIRYE